MNRLSMLLFYLCTLTMGSIATLQLFVEENIDTHTDTFSSSDRANINRHLRSFSDTDTTSLSDREQSALYPLNSPYEAASDSEIKISNLSKLSPSIPCLKKQPKTEEHVIREMKTDLLDTNAWNRLPQDSNTRMYHIRQQ